MVVMSLNAQSEHLQNVSRTFALTIPVLPKQLMDWVGNAYLLCRIADTIEDDPSLSSELKAKHLDKFIQTLTDATLIDSWSDEIFNLLKSTAKPKEAKLLKDIPAVLGRYYSYPEDVRAILRHGVEIMCKGMAQFKRWDNISSIDDVDQYCYSVAGVVGEILVHLFAVYSPKIKTKLEKLLPLAVSFGEGLQLTNILKDVWDDAARGVKWLPLDYSSEEGKIQTTRNYVSIAYGHVLQACEFIYMLPRTEPRIRSFCLLANAMAVLTLKNIYKNPLFKSASEIKITRKDVKKVIAETNVLLYTNWGLKLLFAHYAEKDMQYKMRDAMVLRNKVSYW